MDFKERKNVKLKRFDYSSAGSYFITICVRDRMRVLSTVLRNEVYTNKSSNLSEFIGNISPFQFGEITVKLSGCGEIVERELLKLPDRYTGVFVDAYIIMPDHIHAIVRISSKQEESNKKVTLHEIVGGFKSLASRACYKKYGIEKIFQRSYMEHIIRDSAEYDEIAEYIRKNPNRWYHSER